MLAASCALTACGDDDDAADATTATAVTSPITAPSTPGRANAGPGGTTAPAGGDRGDAAAFCDNEIAAEQAFLTEDPAVIGPAFEALQAAAPGELTDSVSTLLAAAEEGGPEFDAAYADVIGYMKQHCGFTDLEVTAGDFHFDGMPPSVPAGPAILTLDNAGEELHQIMLLRLDDGVTDTVEALAALPEDAVMAKGEPMGMSFAFPGQQGFGTMSLTPGRYVALCFIPVGTTPEAIEEMESAGAEGPPDSAPHAPTHASAGMVVEFDVT